MIALVIFLVIIIIALIFIFMIRERRIKSEFVRQQEIIDEHRKKSVIWEEGILRSQIQPHFIYNVLNTIKYLCKHNPKEASEAIDRFSAFLRESMDAFSLHECIPFEDEIEIVNNYIYLEKKRFGDKVDVEFNLECTDFAIPALSVQPLVENAIKHGITKRLGGGCVWISAKESPEEYTVEIKDNGVGFYVEGPKDPNKSHVGLENTKNRLALMCGGDLDIISDVDMGTTITIHIPKENEDE